MPTRPSLPFVIVMMVLVIVLSYFILDRAGVEDGETPVQPTPAGQMM